MLTPVTSKSLPIDPVFVFMYSLDEAEAVNPEVTVVVMVAAPSAVQSYAPYVLNVMVNLKLPDVLRVSIAVAAAAALKRARASNVPV